ncbi:MAG TPA: nickel pincer cofactor biosynthesis protein LarC [Blastocatellia bacterium]|nr:nickel pincer cofactor biosynthesis protein LarC [Blastocatellia bacterium]
MARTLYLDCFAGASGDMLVGAMLDSGLDFELLRSALLKLGVEGYELSLGRVDRSGISAAKFDVHLTGEPQQHGHHHNHDHSHGEHSHGHGRQSHHRSLSEIKGIISSSNLSEPVKQRAQAIFQRIGEAEAKIHDVPIETVHFHEVGAIDSIVDIVGACVAFDALKIERIISSPLHVGSGTFQCAHGTYPVPGPATAELLKGVPIYSKDVEGELVTPTGAAIISTLAEGYGSMPMMKIENIGYGAGTRDYPKFPNALRAIIGELEEDADRTPGAVTIIEANIDDLNAQVFGYLMEKALAAGALDIFYTPVQMKKNRPGVLLTLLCNPPDRERMCDLIFRETTTLGVRYRNEQREILTREFVTVETEYGPIRVKVSRARDGRVMNASPEFEDCRVAAEKSGVGLRDAQTAALKAYVNS